MGAQAASEVTIAARTIYFTFCIIIEVLDKYHWGLRTVYTQHGVKSLKNYYVSRKKHGYQPARYDPLPHD